MTVNVTVLGLGRVGGSLARRLTVAAQDPRQPAVRVAGYDRDTALARDAQRQGALHKSHLNMLQAVEQADLVLLTGPLAEQHENLRLIAPELRAGSVVAAVGPLLGPPLAWAAELLAGRAARHCVACHPALNPAQLYTGETGFAASNPDLFERGLWALAPAPGCAPEAAQLVADVVRLLGAFPYFVDPTEHDGLVAATEALPALFALALLQAAATSAGWPETRKIADRSFATATAALVEADPAALRANRGNTLRYLDAALEELQALRRHLAAGETAAVDEFLAQAADRRAAWLADRRRGDWEHLDETKANMPTTSDMLGHFLVGGLLSKRGDNSTGGESR
jgi:prephenate dehydrogenase